jgi:predicted CXXCH cytochrome family protein
MWPVLSKSNFLSNFSMRNPFLAKTTVKLLLLITLIPAMALSDETAAFENSIPLHHFDIACENCHEPARQGNEPAPPQDIKINQGCSLVGCHNYDAAMSHPVGVKVTSNPDGLPLNSNSQITCITCHQTSQAPESAKPSSANSNNDLVINISAGFALCSSCHSQSGGSLKKQSHWRDMPAHLVKLNPNSTTNTTLGMTEMVDSESRSCLGCHEDVTVSIPSFNGNSGFRNRNSQGMSGHSIGVNYNLAEMRRTGTQKLRRNLKKNIRLFDGNVGCGSCHSLYSRNEMNLVRENPKGELCMECHDMGR